MLEYDQAELVDLTEQIMQLGDTWRRIAELMSVVTTPEAPPKPPVTILLL
jgi:hypothetical protein